MSSLMVAVLLALCGGIAVGFQGPLASMVGQRVGALGSGFVLHLSGAVIAGVLVLLTGWQAMSGLRDVPWYALVGTGACGVIVIAAFSLAVPKIGMTATAGLIIASQLVVAALLDHFGLLGLAHRSMTMVRLAGMGVLMLGAWMVLR